MRTQYVTCQSEKSEQTFKIFINIDAMLLGKSKFLHVMRKQMNRHLSVLLTYTPFRLKNRSE